MKIYAFEIVDDETGEVTSVGIEAESFKHATERFYKYPWSLDPAKRPEVEYGRLLYDCDIFLPL